MKYKLSLFAVSVIDLLSVSPPLVPSLLQNLTWERKGGLLVKCTVD